ncbi:unnamed protein product [Prorocentrum cordatum]|uniref:Beta-glucosidase n=1 Tax=Prorocentrum cordatum TaxID=2364126 RepID=A0ABN9U0A4_9DINO|nr:unnamed protein product [Polarella glacialis]
MMASLGVHAYRFSISWSRLIPDGEGEVNEEGARFYSDLVDELLAHNITPWVTLYHWDLPSALEAEFGGWLGPKERVTAAFGAYARACFELLGDRVKHWVTLNEPWRGCHVPPHRAMALQAVTAVAVHAATFRNVDLPHQGLYHLCCCLSQCRDGRLSPCVPHILPPERDTDVRALLPARLASGAGFQTKSVFIRFSDEEAVLDDVVQFRIEGEPGAAPPQLQLEVKLMYADLCDGELPAGDPDESARADDVALPRVSPSKLFEVQFQELSKKTFRLCGAAEPMHAYCPCVFEENYRPSAAWASWCTPASWTSGCASCPRRSPCRPARARPHGSRSGCPRTRAACCTSRDCGTPGRARAGPGGSLGGPRPASLAEDLVRLARGAEPPRSPPAAPAGGCSEGSTPRDAPESGVAAAVDLLQRRCVGRLAEARQDLVGFLQAVPRHHADDHALSDAHSLPVPRRSANGYTLLLTSLEGRRILLRVVPFSITFCIIASFLSPFLSRHVCTFAEQEEQLVTFSLEHAECFCCSNGHRHPETHDAIPCDRELIRATVINWFGDVDRFDIFVREKLLSHTVRHARIPYRYLVACIGPPILWDMVGRVVWHFRAGQGALAWRLMLQQMSLVFLFNPLFFNVVMRSFSMWCKPGVARARMAVLSVLTMTFAHFLMWLSWRAVIHALGIYGYIIITITYSSVILLIRCVDT